MKAIVQCDFDGTITMNNLSILLREQFAGNKWRVIEADYLAGRLTVEESNRRQFFLIKEPREILNSFIINNIRVRSGFFEFVKYCHTSGLRLVIVSVGLDFYIDTILKSIGISRLEVHCGLTDFGQDGIAVKYMSPEGYFIMDDFKCRYLKWFQKQESHIIYVGDGLSDLDAAKNANQVFATGHLHSLLAEASIRHNCFSSFKEIIRHFNRFY